MSELDNLRAEVRRQHRNAVSKASRLRRLKGVEVVGTGYDPRRDISKVKRYNKTQLNSYLEELQTFNSRSNNFVAGSASQPIPTQLWREYKSLEGRYNRAGDRRAEEVGDIFIPNSGLTIAERKATILPKVKHAMGQISQAPYVSIDMKAASVNGVKAVQKLIDSMKKKVARDYYPNAVKKGRAQLNLILDVIADDELTKRINNLSDDQFDILWSHTNFGAEIVPPYMARKAMAMGFEKNDIITAISPDGNIDAANEFVAWAETLPEKTTRRPAKKTGRGKKKA